MPGKVHSLFAAMLLAASAHAQTSPQFLSTALDVSTEVSASALMDFRSDGVMDLVSVQNSSLGVCAEVRFGDGSGGFRPPIQEVKWGVSGDVADLTVGDMNGDGRDDLVGVVGRFLHVSRGLFTGLTPFLNFPVPTNDDLLEVDLEDVDGDGNLDAIMRTKFEIFLNRGRGDGTFEPTEALYSSTRVANAEPADINADGVIDIVVADRDLATVVLLIGTGDGTFTPSNVAPGAIPLDVAIADFNGDHHLDLAVGVFADPGLLILAGAGDGTFGPALGVALTTGSTFSVTAGQYNGDGIIDLIVVPTLNIGNPGSRFATLLGNGDGTFTELPTEVVQSQISKIEAAHLNGDTVTDWVITSGRSTISFGGIVIGIGREGERLTSAGAPFTSGAKLIAADFDNDGKDDFITSDGPGSFLVVMAPLDDPIVTSFSPSTAFYTAYGVGDVAGDANLDIVATGATGFARTVFIGNGDGTFADGASPPAPLPPGQAPVALHLADLDGDGKDEVAELLVTGLTRFYDVTAAGDLVSVAQTSEDIDVQAILLEDFDQNGDVDLLEITSSELRYSSGLPNIVDFAPPFVSVGFTDIDVVLPTQLDESPIVDLVITSGDRVDMVTGKETVGGVIFSTTSIFTPPFDIDDAAVLDRDNDGLSELALISQEQLAITIYDLFTFGMPVLERMQDVGTQITVASLDGDEFDDLIAKRLFVRVPPAAWSTVVGANYSGLPLATLRGKGTPSPGSDIQIVYNEGLPNTPVVLVVGLDVNPFQTFKLNLVVPTPDLLFFLPPTDTAGELTLDATWTDFPAGVDLWLQGLQLDGANTRSSTALMLTSQ